MSTYDSNGMERVPFDGRYDRPTHRPKRYRLAGHGSGCSANPEIGCVCGEDDRQNESAPPDREMIPAAYLCAGQRVRLLGGVVEVVSVELLDGEARITHRTDFAGGTFLLCDQTVDASRPVEVVE